MPADFNTNIPHCLIANTEVAHNYGFSIEGGIAFIFDLGCALGCLGYNTMERTWQFDTINDDADPWQFIEKDLAVAIEKATNITKMVRAACALRPKGFDVTEFLDRACPELAAY